MRGACGPACQDQAVPGQRNDKMRGQHAGTQVLPDPCTWHRSHLACYPRWRAKPALRAKALTRQAWATSLLWSCWPGETEQIVGSDLPDVWCLPFQGAQQWSGTSNTCLSQDQVAF